MINEQERKKIEFIKNINNEKNSRLEFFSNLSDLQSQNISYSSILLYDKSFSFEIFGSSRDEIAEYNLNLKKKNLNNKYKIAFVSTRPGSKGGVFALYNAKLGSGSGGTPPSDDPKIEANIQQFVKNIANRNNLKMKSDRSVDRKTVGQFEKIRMEYIYSGNEDNCKKFLKDLGNANNNFSIYKISLLPMNQRDFSKSNYKLLLILDFYV